MDKYTFQYENECFVLACLLHDPSLMEECLLQPKHFLDSHNQRIFQLMKQMHADGERISVISFAKLGVSELARFGGLNHISEIMNGVPSLSGFDSYQQYILDFHTIQYANQVANDFLDKTKERHLLKDLYTFLNATTNLESATTQTSATFQELLHERYKYHRDTPMHGLSGVHTGFLCLNERTDGWQNGDLIIVAARPSMGKTAFVLNSFLNGCKKDELFATFFSVEMSKGQVIDRFLAMEANVNLHKLRNPTKTFTREEWSRYTKAIGTLTSLSIDIREEYTVQTIRSATKRNIRENPEKKHVVAIDFLTLLKHPNPSGNSHKDVTDIIQDLKQMAKDLNIPVVVIAQLNRGVEQRQDKRPTMSDIRESGSIEQIADFILFLYREEYYRPKSNKNGVTELLIVKNRNGPTGTVTLNFAKETNIFREIVS
ncbi:replicative DNA helicase [Heyndrickxia vini]|uniref:DNA 5'-3' helicase n=1 Tax=Heyndrickxia vini TaxID=1476025 RepID=A0ABX7E2U3_9BACI|nr:DnaB-like helicase C-terminal domain-containing protein [Heyndrickxia vini]QQZ10038.1 AAA family ATPase [Heyndrickxia vini]